MLKRKEYMSDDLEFQKVELTPEAPVVEEAPEVRDVVKPVMETKKSNKRTLVILSLIVVLAGIGTGYALSQLVPLKTVSGGQAITQTPTAEEGVKVGAVYGSKDESTFPDKVEGVIVKGGIDGEGTHRLLRPGGVSQTVYLTSTVLDLDLFVDHKVKVAGETFAAQKAGWLMDAGRVEVVELNAEKPFTE